MKRLFSFLLALLLALISAAVPAAPTVSQQVGERIGSVVYDVTHKDEFSPFEQKTGPPTLALSATQHTSPHWVQGNSARQQLTNVLNDLGSTVADYQPGNYTGTLNASAWLNSIGAAPSLTQASGAAQPIILPFSGQKYAYLPGVNGNEYTTPSAAANQITGDIDIRVYVALNNWASTTQCLIGKYVASGTLGSYYLRVDPTGTLTLVTTPNGSNASAITALSTAAVGFSAGTAHWVRVTRAAASGNVIFYTSTDGVAWTKLGNTVPGTAQAIFASTSVVEVGAINGGGTYPVLGKIYRAQIYNGINGTLAVDFNASDWPETTTNGATAVSSTTGETWTLANTGTLVGQIVGSPQLVGDGVASLMQMTATIPPPYFVIAVVKPITWTSTDVLFDGKTSNSFAAQQITGTPQVKMYDGTNLTGAINPTLNTYAIITAGQDAAGNATIQRNNGTPATGTLNATALGGFTLFGNGAGTKFGNAQVKEVILLNAIPSAAKEAQILNLLNQIYHIYAPYASANDWLNELPTVAANDETYRLAANGR